MNTASIPDYPGYTLYEDGRVYSHKRNKFLKIYTTHPQLYPLVKLSNGVKNHRYHKLHRLLASAFIPNPDNHPCVLHRDDDRTNHSLDNLYWGTMSDNAYDYWRNNKRVYWRGETKIVNRKTQ